MRLVALVLAFGLLGSGAAVAEPGFVHAQVVPVKARDVAGGPAVGAVYEGRQSLPVPCCEQVVPVEDWAGASPFAVGLRVLGGGVDGGLGGAEEHFRLLGPDGRSLYALLGARSSVGCAPDGSTRSETPPVLVKTEAGERWVSGAEPDAVGVPVGDEVADLVLTRVTGEGDVAEFVDVWPGDWSAAAGWVVDLRVGAAHHRYLVAGGYCVGRAG
ncbi:hypothetical protein ACFFQW_36660 [Umezawaea endophytica]|uniref:Uncharacterized protein n=1 Tax=Umezawaea endophytica TaxID=1654476 RepID=A0A9X3A2R9_9PSEU|nr:hypothetical protein [Umezawaea endophytica]MCS7480929.1 hypothetical protein [Umezawaea endophytica]